MKTLVDYLTPGVLLWGPAGGCRSSALVGLAPSLLAETFTLQLLHSSGQQPGGGGAERRTAVVLRDQEVADHFFRAQADTGGREHLDPATFLLRHRRSDDLQERNARPITHARG